MITGKTNGVPLYVWYKVYTGLTTDFSNVSIVTPKNTAATGLYTPLPVSTFDFESSTVEDSIVNIGQLPGQTGFTWVDRGNSINGTATEVISADKAHSGTKSALFTDYHLYAAAEAVYSNTALTDKRGTFKVSVHIPAGSLINEQVYIALGDSALETSTITTTQRIIELAYGSEGYLKIRNSSDPASVLVPILPFNYDTWYDISLTYDVTDRKYDLYIDGIFKGTFDACVAGSANLAIKKLQLKVGNTTSAARPSVCAYYDHIGWATAP